jgi:hypothetical protein
MAERGHVSKVIRERAMAILRETRAKIDPRLLDAMKERIGETMPQMAGATHVPRAERDTVFKPEEKFVPPMMEDVLPASSSYNEPVDKQKIAQIVLQYMKYREDSQKH